ncbi:MAG: GerMN domain-containing protein [Spirochaetales bacterium]|nr:GerMN domain-containing protein [Spirochaetales bacterium]
MKMKLTIEHYLYITAGFLLLILVISLIAFGVQKGDRTRRVLFFPEIFSGKLNGEVRYIKQQKDLEHNISAFIDELCLGPSLPNLSRLFPKETRLLSLLIDDTHIYLNFSREMIFPDSTIKLDTNSILKALIGNIDYNFSRVKTVSIYMNGEPVVPDSGIAYEGDEFETKVEFYSGLLK